MISGITGQDGGYLAKLLLQKNNLKCLVKLKSFRMMMLADIERVEKEVL